MAVTADRRRDEQAVLLERLGLEVLMFPLLRTEAEDTGPLRALSEHLCRQPPDYFVANTGYGMRTWLQLSAQWGLQEALVQALRAGSTIVARGAKALGEMRKVGLDAWYTAPGETLDEVVARLCQEDLRGASVVVQLHGEAPGALLARLEGSGAKVTYLPVYRMTVGGAQAAADLISAVIGHGVDAVTFTAAPQIQALAEVAGTRGLTAALLDAFNEAGVVAACIGPVCAAAALAAGIERPLVPEHPRLARCRARAGGLPSPATSPDLTATSPDLTGTSPDLTATSPDLTVASRRHPAGRRRPGRSSRVRRSPWRRPALCGHIRCTAPSRRPAQGHDGAVSVHDVVARAGDGDIYPHGATHPRGGGGAVKLGIAEGINGTLGGHQPVTAPVRAGRYAHEPSPAATGGTP